MTKRLKRVPSALSGLRRAEPPKDLGEHGNAMIGGDIRRSPHSLGPRAKIHNSFYRN
jgi:hypothetical protein